MSTHPPKTTTHEERVVFVHPNYGRVVIELPMHLEVFSEIAGILAKANYDFPTGAKL